MSRRPTKTCSHEILPYTTVFGDILNIVKLEDGKAYISVLRVCEHLGIAYPTQHTKLNSKSWANLTKIGTLDERGRSFPQLFLDIDCLPYWMASIHVGRVAEHLRPKIEWYQKQARDVLAATFLPPEIRNTQPDVTVNVDNGITKSMWGDLMAKLDSWTHWSRKVESDVATVAKETRENSETVATLQAKVERLEGTIREMAQLCHEMDPRAKARGYKKPFMELWDRLCS